MGKKINWYNGKNALNPADMQKICDNVAESTTPQNLAEVIKGSDTVVVDVAEDNKSLEVHLDTETTNEISRSLKTPMSAPASTQLVAVNDANSQEMINIGSGLNLLDGILSSKNVLDIQQFEDQSVAEIRSKILEFFNTGKQVFVIFKYKASSINVACSHITCNPTDFTISSVNADVAFLNYNTRTLFGVVANAAENATIDLNVIGNAPGKIQITTNNYISGNYVVHPAPYSAGITIAVDINAKNLASPSATFDMTYILV